ncbi:MAG: carboxylating nicotinate-nucleotide diphosphorylase [Atopobiaceae bacterium]|jgi:nicotinate-nucleotide pyrophosphorylase|nr:carboxylating nicotinate-nucleotide diphosphorylase [Atopobiaceae bacterium]MCH4180849.1 carboxylating nicotinate-nucleotide diphosphorylase [Atopobiaceae bacterium]MCH4213478.1 carboxylating nicotinate-nucleotide diphosphorylase [Atopobiaceae bacterium]MCH4230422.1 carboxylating nicotinate-nucleotide diphosphorylase [Atopobiaceae bacterium]MCH4277147.1 carboxylating nicotinate-nucleotide diphosphorylase [Atopobiaceae bacterium]
MNDITLHVVADGLIRSALAEDITSEDVTTASVMPEACPGTVDLICKQDGVICGLDVFCRTFELLDPATSFDLLAADGDEVHAGDLLAHVSGDIRVLLSGERVALNYLQRMSGIATYTHHMAALLAGSGITLLDTRKTTPNCRVFEKYAVTVGGGANHRYNLSDGVLLKDNHIGAAGGVRQAVLAAKAHAPFVRKIEVECETNEQVREAVEAGADIIMLDNMEPGQMRDAIDLIAGRAQTECSGNVTAQNVSRYLGLGLDYISCGALTHSAGILDVSLKHLHPCEADAAATSVPAVEGGDAR